MDLPAPLRASNVKADADFVAIASRYTLLRRSGRQYVGLCPLHQERHPSFYLHPDKKVFYCFGCGAGGDLFRFVMLAEGLSFSEAVRWVADFRGGRRTRPAVFAGRVSQGAKPPQPAKQAAPHSQKGEEPRPRAVPGLGDWPSLDCAAERAALLLESEG